MKRERGKNEVSKGSYGKRPDGTEKGRGWLGELKLPNGGVATEYSVGVNLGGKETLIPTLVPTLTKEQVATMVNDVIPNRKDVPEDILRSAALHAKERIAKGESVWAPTNAVKEVRQANAGGDAGDNLQEPDVPVNSEPVADTDVNNGPRIAVNPEVFNDKRDALCVAFNEAYRVVMEMNGFDPVSEPTDKQREFFADTAYADDETMLRRTILARICTFDTSVVDPTDEQLQEAVEFLSTVMEIGAPQNRWEQSIVQRTKDILEKSIGMPRGEGAPQNPAPTDDTTVQGAIGGGETDEERTRKQAMTSQLQNRETMTAQLQNRNTMTAQLQNRNTMTAQLQNRNTMTAQLQNRQTMTTQLQNRNTMTSQLQNRDTMTAQLQNRQTMTQQLQNRDTMTAQLQNRQTMTQQLQNRDTMTAQLQNRDTMTAQLQNRQTMTQQLQTRTTMTQQLQARQTMTQQLQSKGNMMTQLQDRTTMRSQLKDRDTMKSQLQNAGQMKRPFDDRV